MTRTKDLRGDDVIDSRDVIARIRELESDVDTLYSEWFEQQQEDGAIAEDAEETDSAYRERFNDEHQDDPTVEELRALMALEEEASSYSDWRYGAALIRDSYFEQYAMELAEDIGAIDHDAKWPLNYIDWEAAAEALKTDYTSVEFDGETYWIS